jgi:O-antigen ligase
MVNRGVLPGVAVESEQPNPMQGGVFTFSMILVFIYFSMIHQILTVSIGMNLYLLYFFGIPALLGILVTGGIQRTFQRRPGVYLMLFAAWLLIALPFSSWKGGSVFLLSVYFRAHLLILFVVAGSTVTWSHCRRMMKAIALAAVVGLAASQLFSRIDANDRMQLTVGTVANSNDYAGHLILVLPFLLWVVMTGKTFVFRMIALALIPYGFYAILATASRGALIAIGVALLYAFSVANARQRFPMLILAPAMFLAAIGFLPSKTWQRLISFSDATTASIEALESSHDREYLLRTSLTYIIQNPIFGVGAGEFSDYEGNSSKKQGRFGLWHETHNTYTQIASENGLPALFFYVAAIASSMGLLTRVHRASKNRPEFREIGATSFCLMLSFVGFCTAIFFLNFAYTFYLPALVGLAISVSVAAEVEFKKAAARLPATVPVQPNLGPFGRPPRRTLLPRTSRFEHQSRPR